MIRFVALALCLLAGPAMAQKLTVCMTAECGRWSAGDGIFHFPPPVLATPHAATGDADLDRAMGICDAHHYIPQMLSPPLPQYDSGYGEACSAVERRWDASDGMKRAREEAAAEHERQDRAFIEQFVKK